MVNVESRVDPRPWFLEVRGAPPRVRQRSGKTAELTWREAIRDKVRKTYPEAPFEPELGSRYAVSVIFRMTAAELAREAVDLDNLVKPVLDTLLTSKNVSSERPTGVLLSVNDTWVFVLHAEKIQVASQEEQGADITVRVSPPQ